MQKAYLILENGSVFEGERIGAVKDSVGELVFTTGMCGYLETLTDPSYLGQIIMQTFPLIGNYGVIPGDFEGECFAAGYIAREICDAPSNFRSQGTLGDYLTEKGIPGIVGVDTRLITLTLRDFGTMNAMIASEIPTDLTPIKNYKIKNAVARLSRGVTRIVNAVGERKYTVALYDYGAKHHIVDELTMRGCDVVMFPADATASDILAIKPDGLMLSNGPGDPAENEDCINELRSLLGALPIFGICLGHQLLALAAGARTEKLPFGHRGANQPVKDIDRGLTLITSQNHGYTVVPQSLPENARIRFINANDHTCEGIEYPSYNAFSVQFHPEGCAGPLDTEFLFDRFVSNMEVNRHAAH